jgi:L-aspartate oxidase
MRTGPQPDAVVIGSGAAGLATALALSPLRVLLLTKEPALESGASPYAQGGIAAALGEDDAPDLHARDTVEAGAGLTEEGVAASFAREAAALVRGLLAEGVPFDRSPGGAPRLGREAAHSRARIVHAGGDATGRALVRALADRVRATPSIAVATEAFALDLAMRGGRVVGVVARHRDGGTVLHPCPRVALATGGIGAAYLRTTNPASATGDGLAMAARAGARLADLEFVQFHPTALAAGPAAGLAPGARMPLLTEALRGAGATLLDARGRRFMAAEHPLAELAPRDVVARAVWRRVAAGERVLLDARAVLAGDADAFPTAVAACRATGLDPRREPVPVAPAAHYHMGGVATDEAGRTSVPGLWACGEVACTGLHGANRLASNSLAEALVAARRVAADMRGRAAEALPDPDLGPGPPPRGAAAFPDPGPPRAAGFPPGAYEPAGRLRLEARTALYELVGLSRDAAGLEAAASRCAGSLAALPPVPPRGFEDALSWGEARNVLLVGRLVAEAALARRESRGAHFRADHPRPRPEWRRRRFVALEPVAGGLDDAARAPLRVQGFDRPAVHAEPQAGPGSPSHPQQPEAACRTP